MVPKGYTLGCFYNIRLALCKMTFVVNPSLSHRCRATSSLRSGQALGSASGVCTFCSDSGELFCHNLALTNSLCPARLGCGPRKGNRSQEHQASWKPSRPACAGLQAGAGWEEGGAGGGSSGLVKAGMCMKTKG